MTTTLTSPALVGADEALPLAAMLRDRASANPDLPFAEHKDASGAWMKTSIGEFETQVRAVAKGLVATGIGIGDRVGLTANNRYEWAVIDFAIQTAGAVTVPVYPTSSASQVSWIAEDANIGLFIVENDAMRDAAAESGVKTLVIDDGAVQELALAGADVTDADLDARTADTSVDDLATLIYTSGTTGRPKGVMLSHRNLTEHCLNIERDVHFGAFVTAPSPRLLLFLPMAHVFGRLAMILSVSAGSVVGFAPDTKVLADDMKTFRPTWMVVVPRVLETVYNKADAKNEGLKKTIFRWSAKVTRKFSRARQDGHVGIVLALQHRVADALVLKKIREAMGGQLQFVLSGGAKLGYDIGHFFRGAGVTVMEGYGLSETTAAATGTPVDDIVTGTVGNPIAGCSASLADDGEILLKGPNLFQGYWNNAEATAEAIDADGWFHTGDLGEIVDGRLSVTGRKKEILVLSSGKNVQVAQLENAMRSHPAIQDTVVVGEGKHFVSALVALDEVMLPPWLRSHGLPEMTVEEASLNEKVRELVGRAVAAANSHVSRAESIREFRILPRSFDEKREEVSAALKIRRTVILKNFSDVVDEMYARVPDVKLPGKKNRGRKAA